MELEPIDERVTIGALFDRYQGLILKSVAPGTGRGYLSAWRQRVAPTFAEWAVADLRTLDVRLAFVEWSGSRSTRVDALSMLSAVCGIAVEAGIIATNPCRGAKIPRAREYDPASRALTLEELDRLLSLLPAEGPYCRFVLVMLYTGCRLGEVAAFRASDVDSGMGFIRVARSASAGLHGENNEGPTKGRRVRVVPIIPQLLPIVIVAMEGKGEHDRLFPGPRGGVINSKNLTRALKWHSIRDRVKTFPPGQPSLHWHDLRHTAAVLLFLAGVVAPDVQAIMGHSSLLVTQLYADTRTHATKRGGPKLAALWAAHSKGQLRGGEESAEPAADLGF